VPTVPPTDERSLRPVHFVPLGLDAPERTVGLTGLCPFEIVTPPPADLRRAPGILQVSLDLPRGCELNPGSSVTYRVRGAEAGLIFDRDGEIVTRREMRCPLELPYQARRVTSPPAAAEMCLDLSFWYRIEGGSPIGQDVQWRQRVRYTKTGGTRLELRFALVE
jgi:hypothetical protein